MRSDLPVRTSFEKKRAQEDLLRDLHIACIYIEMIAYGAGGRGRMAPCVTGLWPGASVTAPARRTRIHGEDQLDSRSAVPDSRRASVEKGHGRGH